MGEPCSCKKFGAICCEYGEEIVRRSVVAIIDDDASVRCALGKLLSAYEYTAELFASARAFLSAAETSEATCLVVDIQLGDFSGVELARRLAASGFKFPIIFMTGSDDDRIRAQAMDFGCVAFLHKPFSACQLFAAIKTATG
jgi:FixJ family two-component response regulator